MSRPGPCIEFLSVLRDGGRDLATRLGSRSPVGRPGVIRHRGMIPRCSNLGKRWVNLIHSKVLVGDDGAGSWRWCRPGCSAGIGVTLRSLRVRGWFTSTSSFGRSAFELLFQVLVLTLQVLDGLLKGTDVPFVFVVLSVGSGDDSRVDIRVSTLLGVEVVIVVVIHVCVHVHSVALAFNASAGVKDDSFTVDSPSPGGGGAGANTSSPVV